ncbi:MAG: ABC transporter ATP-binding protein [Ruminococcaceae bacterium]|jgi:oligopeptide/dipeptide ABC transporter ATP-binding protein|nr:ABC transporter ATP-binding protein [Oscillospiraceae bacterium]
MSEPILSLSRLTVGYRGRAAVADVSFTLRRGEILCLVGESGCGKSTLLKALISSPEVTLLSGEITLRGESLCALSAKARAKKCRETMGMVFQSPGAAFNPIRTYRAQFTETLKSHGKYDAAAFERQAAEALGKLELQDGEKLLRECPYALSGGMNQRMALSLAMLLGQDILLGDEPTSALDATIQLQVAKELKALRDDSGVTQIVVTHNVALARFLADRIGVMYAGRLVELGGASEVLNRPQHPYTRSLMAAVPTLGGNMPAGLAGQPPLTGPAGAGCAFRDRCPHAADGCGARIYELRQVGEDHLAACCEGVRAP